MATKSKNISFSIFFKVLAVAVGLFGTLQVYSGMGAYRDFPCGLEADYLQSAMLAEEVAAVRERLAVILTLRGEDYILSGQALSATEVEQELAAAMQERKAAIQRVTDKYDAQIEAAIRMDSQEDKARLEWERSEKLAMIKTDFDNKQAAAKDALAAKKIKLFNEAKSFIDNYDGLFYSIMDNNQASSKEPEAYLALPYHGKVVLNQEQVAYIAFSETVFQRQAALFEPRHKNGAAGIYRTAGGLILITFSLLWLMYSAGRSSSGERLSWAPWERLYLDAALLLFAAAGTLSGSAGISIALEEQSRIAPLMIQGGQLALVVAYLLCAAYAVMLAKRLRSGSLLRHTALYRLLYELWQVVGGGALFIKAVAFQCLYLTALAGSGVLFWQLRERYALLGEIAGVILFLAVNYAAAKVLLKRLEGFKALAEGIKRIKDGQMECEIGPCGSPGIDEVIHDLNHLADGLKNALEREVKAEHMKVELITNVSHDLKTPLTSIISYSDLLSRSGLNEEQMQKYVAIIQSKSIRLQHLVDDLFEISKAQSGTIALKLEALCLNDLLTQAYAEYEDGFSATELAMVMSVPEEKIMVMADGTKLWRVMSNVLNNAIKYSLAGTRVYVDVWRSEDLAYVTVKNIASYPMNFNEVEIVERFARGDESRTGDGSGLGLAIVKSFMELQKGSCELTVDGDLFKIRLGVPLLK